MTLVGQRLRCGGTRVLSVRRRVQLSFAAGGLLLSLLLGVVTWTVTSRSLIREAEASALRQAVASRAQLAQGLVGTSGPADVLVRSRSPGKDALLLFEGAQFSTRLGLSPNDLPFDLRAQASRGTAVTQRLRLNGEPVLAVALPLGASGNVYIELSRLSDVEITLRILTLVLIGGGALATVFGASLGVWASSRTLRPLRVLSDGAAAVARGELATRLDGSADPDLEPLARAFNAHTRELQERVRRDERFAADVSHELRSPITTMVNAAHVLDRYSSGLSGQGREALSILEGELTAFSVLVEDLLTVSRDVEATDLVLVECRLSEVVRRVIGPLGGEALLEVGPEGEAARVRVDLQRLRRLLRNLLANAESHGGGCRRVCLDVAGGHVRLAVSDRGSGVPVELRERIFERFYRGPPHSQRRGAGLGLAMVRQDVRAHGGQVWVEDDAGGGARFVVLLPRVQTGT